MDELPLNRKEMTTTWARSTALHPCEWRHQGRDWCGSSSVRSIAGLTEDVLAGEACRHGKHGGAAASLLNHAYRLHKDRNLATLFSSTVRYSLPTQNHCLVTIHYGKNSTLYISRILAALEFVSFARFILLYTITNVLT